MDDWIGLIGGEIPLNQRPPMTDGAGAKAKVQSGKRWRVEKLRSGNEVVCREPDQMTFLMLAGEADGIAEYLNDAEAENEELRNALAAAQATVAEIIDGYRYLMAPPKRRKSWPEPGWSVLARANHALAALAPTEEAT